MATALFACLAILFFFFLLEDLDKKYTTLFDCLLSRLKIITDHLLFARLFPKWLNRFVVFILFADLLS